MGEKTVHKLTLSIYRSEPESHARLDDLDVGSVLGKLVEEPLYGHEGSIKIEVERTHEWEIILLLAIAGSSIFASSALKRLGDHFGDWLARQMRLLETEQKPELRTSSTPTLPVDPNDLDNCKLEIMNLLEKASKNRMEIKIVVEPK